MTIREGGFPDCHPGYALHPRPRPSTLKGEGRKSAQISFVNTPSKPAEIQWRYHGEGFIVRSQEVDKNFGFECWVFLLNKRLSP